MLLFFFLGHAVQYALHIEAIQSRSQTSVTRITRPPAPCIERALLEAAQNERPGGWWVRAGFGLPESAALEACPLIGVKTMNELNRSDSCRTRCDAVLLREK